MNGVLENLTNPALLFFVLGILAVKFKNDLMIPESSSKFISMYLLLCIGFKGGNELSHNALNSETFGSLLLGFSLASLIPIAAFLILRRKVNAQNAGAIAAAYGSVSAVTFVTAISFLDFAGVGFDGYMIAVMALMEAPAIVIGILLIRMANKRNPEGAHSSSSFREVFNHSINNASVFLILGSLLIGYLASDQQAEGIKPFTTDIFKGFLAVFLLDMGIRAGRELGGMRKNGLFLVLFACLFPFFSGLTALGLSSFLTNSAGNMLLFSLLGAGASYIAVPAAYKQAVPEANPGIYLPMALGITFPINIILGIPFYFYIINNLLAIA
ncbi:MAG: sodium-dependent bicarbonate transport family permease [Bacteroidetes bacterium]|nr:sodium-dependent bicarbonate transport family permease [Bacteroidota bacterium]